MNVEQRALRFGCRSCSLFGVLSLPERAQPRGVLVITGGPQYRAGSHRQFALLAHNLAAAGVPVLRFDYRGMGDSEGAARDFSQIDDDIACAVAQFFDAVPALRELVLWGLCDGATAAACYAAREPRIRGLILLNPWVRSEAGLARATLRHYYLARLRDGAFWRKLVAGAVRPLAVLRSLGRQLGAARAPAGTGGVPERLLEGWSRFGGRSLVILSGDDLGAREFDAVQRSSAAWRRLAGGPRVRCVWVAGANHTFSRAEWRDGVARLCAQWLASW